MEIYALPLVGFATKQLDGSFVYLMYLDYCLPEVLSILHLSIRNYSGDDDRWWIDNIMMLHTVLYM